MDGLRSRRTPYLRASLMAANLADALHDPYAGPSQKPDPKTEGNRIVKPARGPVAAGRCHPPTWDRSTAPRATAVSGRRAMLAGLVLQLWATRSALAVQEAVVIGDDPEPPCAIELTPEGPELRSGGLEEDWPSSASDLSILPDGRITVVEVFANRFFVASPDNSTGRWVGRQGEGPGEYSDVRWVRPHGNRLHVFDRLLMRRTVLHDTDFSVVDTHLFQRVSALRDVLMLTDSSYVINGRIQTPRSVGYALHLFNRGEVVRSFDEAPYVRGQRSIPGPGRYLALSRDGGVWSAVRTEYRVDLWDAAAGIRQISVIRDAPWFPAHDGGMALDPNGPLPQPVIGGMMEDTAGRIWVAIMVPSEPRWRECLVRTPPGSPPAWGEYTISMGCSYTVGRLEVLDPAAGRLLAAQTLSTPRWISLTRARGDDVVLSVERDEFDFSIVQRWRVALRPVNVNEGQGGGQCLSG